MRIDELTVNANMHTCVGTKYNGSIQLTKDKPLLKSTSFLKEYTVHRKQSGYGALCERIPRKAVHTTVAIKTIIGYGRRRRVSQNN